MASGNVENWLGSLLRETLHSVHMVIKNAWTTIEDPNFQLIEFLNTYPAQVSSYSYSCYNFDVSSCSKSAVLISSRSMRTLD
jgi:hypothetical protein